MISSFNDKNNSIRKCVAFHFRLSNELENLSLMAKENIEDFLKKIKNPNLIKEALNTQTRTFFSTRNPIDKGKYETPIGYYARTNNIKALQALLKFDSDVNIENNRKTPLYWAIKHNNPKMIQLLIEHGANIKDGLQHLDNEYLHTPEIRSALRALFQNPEESWEYLELPLPDISGLSLKNWEMVPQKEEEEEEEEDWEMVNSIPDISELSLED